MRSLEILLSLLCFFLILHHWLYGKLPLLVSRILGAAGLGVPLIQLFLEGYRWQITLLYGISFLLGLKALLRSPAPPSHTRKKGLRALSFVFNLFLFLFFSLTLVVALALPVIQLPEPQGPFPVGTLRLHWTDMSREEAFTSDPSDKRELMVQFWYPTAKDATKERMDLFPDDSLQFEKTIKAYSEGLHLPAFTLGYWKYAKSHSYTDSPILKEAQPYPVVLLCHGLGTGSVLHTSQAENLASHGYVVLAIDHTFSTLATAFPDGRVTGLETSLTTANFYQTGAQLGSLWTEDVSFVLDQLEALGTGEIESPFMGSLNLDKIGIMGHSFGGATAFNAFCLDDRIRAGINMDGGLYNPDVSLISPKPFLFMEAGDYLERLEKRTIENPTHELLETLRMTKEEYVAFIEKGKKEEETIKKVVDQGGKLVYIENSGHFNFTDLQVYSPLISMTGMTGSIDGASCATMVNRYQLEFFDAYLKGLNSPLISGPSPDYPEMKFLNP